MKLLLNTITNKKVLLSFFLLFFTFALIKATNTSLTIPKVYALCPCKGSPGSGWCGPDPYCKYVLCNQPGTSQDVGRQSCVEPPPDTSCSISYSGNCFTLKGGGCNNTITSFEGPSCPTTKYRTSSGPGGAGTYCTSPGNTCDRNCNQVDNSKFDGGVCSCASANCGPTNTPIPTPTKVPCGGSCTQGSQCNLVCPICTAGGICAAPSPTPTPIPCGGPCSPGNGAPNPLCTIACPICAAGPNGGTCLAPSPTPTPVPCGGPCSPIGSGINPKCVIACPICALGPNGGTCLAPTPTPIPCGQSCSPSGPGINPKCDVTCPICASGPGGSVVCTKPTPMPTPICGI